MDPDQLQYIIETVTAFSANYQPQTA
jgi:hypothetical protein